MTLAHTPGTPRFSHIAIAALFGRLAQVTVEDPQAFKDRPGLLRQVVGGLAMDGDIHDRTRHLMTSIGRCHENGSKLIGEFTRWRRRGDGLGVTREFPQMYRLACEVDWQLVEAVEIGPLGAEVFTKRNSAKNEDRLDRQFDGGAAVFLEFGMLTVLPAWARHSKTPEATGMRAHERIHALYALFARAFNLWPPTPDLYDQRTAPLPSEVAAWGIEALRLVQEEICAYLGGSKNRRANRESLGGFSVIDDQARRVHSALRKNDSAIASSYLTAVGRTLSESLRKVYVAKSRALTASSTGWDALQWLVAPVEGDQFSPRAIAPSGRTLIDELYDATVTIDQNVLTVTANLLNRMRSVQMTPADLDGLVDLASFCVDAVRCAPDLFVAADLNPLKTAAQGMREEMVRRATHSMQRWEAAIDAGRPSPETKSLHPVDQLTVFEKLGVLIRTLKSLEGRVDLWFSTELTALQCRRRDGSSLAEVGDRLAEADAPTLGVVVDLLSRPEESVVEGDPRGVIVQCTDALLNVESLGVLSSPKIQGALILDLESRKRLEDCAAQVRKGRAFLLNVMCLNLSRLSEDQRAPAVRMVQERLHDLRLMCPGLLAGIDESHRMVGATVARPAGFWKRVVGLFSS